MKFIRNDLEYTVTNEHKDKYDAVCETGESCSIPKALIRNNYNGSCGYYYTIESVKSYWKNKFDALNTL